MGPEGLPVGQQEVEGAVRCDARREFTQGEGQFLHAGHVGMGFGKLLHDPAERVLAVGGADGVEVRMQAGAEVLQVAVVCEHPVAAPEFAHERMAVLQRHAALRGLAYVRDDVAAADGIAAYQFRDRRIHGPFVVHEMAQALVLEEGDAPAVGVVARPAAALREPREAEGHVGGRVGVHSEQLAHGRWRGREIS